MSCTANIQRVEIRFPFIDGSGLYRAGAIPGPVDPYGQYVVLTQTGPTRDATQGGESVSQRISVPNSDRLRAISISPDSAIHSCDIALGGRVSGNRVRVSPGNPLLGSLDGHDFFAVSVPVSIPLITALAANNFVWDSVIVGQGPATSWAVPLRLELWYDDFPSVRGSQRASYHATARATLSVGQTVDFYVCTDGRGRVVADVNPGGTTTSLTVLGVSPIHNTVTPAADTFSLQQILASAVVPAGGKRYTVIDSAAATSSDRFTPWPLVLFRLTDPTGSIAVNEISVHCWDD